MSAMTTASTRHPDKGIKVAVIKENVGSSSMQVDEQ